MKQIKVIDTRMHPTSKATIGGVEGWVSVADAELVLVKLNNIIPNPGSLATIDSRLEIATCKFNGYRLIKPILISRTERPESL